MFNKYSNLIAVFLLIIMFLLGLFSLINDSGTTDEVAHIPAGYSYLKFRDYRLNPEHPPLIKAWACLPLIFLKLNFPKDLPAWKDDINGQWETGWKFIYHYGNDADLILLLSRIPILILAIILGIYLYRWTSQVFGKKIGLTALFFYSLSPNILAHSRLVTTDLGVAATFFIALYYFYKFYKSPSWKYIILSGLFFGIAQLAKFSNVVLAVYLFLLSLVIIFIFKKEIKIKFPLLNRLKKPLIKKIYFFISSLIIIYLIGFLLVGIVYQIFISNMPLELQHRTINHILAGEELAKTRNFLNALSDNVLTRPYAYYLLGLKMVFQRVAGGNTTYFLGQTSNQSWWYFYPISFLIKTPIAILILFLLSLVGLIKKVQSLKLKTFWQKLIDIINKNFLEFIAWTVIAAFFVIGIMSNLNIGLRHILPLYPFLQILSAKYLISFFYKKKNLIKNIAGIVLLLWYAVSNILIFPHYLAYFNEFVGGYKNGYKYSVDSNLDWGQDLKRLAYWVEKNNIEKITVDYFGGSVPEYYMGDKVLRWHSKYGKPPKGYFAVSATYYQNSKWYKKVSGEEDYSWLDNIKPIANIGGSILVYKME